MRRRPRLSVIVPVYAVEAYIEDCLRSLLSQDVGDIEVIVIDDGSPDASAQIVATLARQDRRVRLLSQPNRGLGAARNRGAAMARGRYLTFVDSDDTVPPGAWGPMLAALDAHNGDLACGRISRLVGGRPRPMPWMERNHVRARGPLTISEMPELLADVFAVNKIFRRTFWRRRGIAFPAIRYEDQVAMTDALLAAASILVLPDTVYEWRIRGDGSSITQGRHTLVDLIDRLQSKRLSTASVRAQGMPEVTRVWFQEVLGVDMWEYFRAAARMFRDRPGDPETLEYWVALRDGVRELWSKETVPFEETRLPTRQRMMGWLVVQDRPEDLCRLIDALDSGEVHRVPGGDGGVELTVPLRGLDGVPSCTYAMQDWER